MSGKEIHHNIRIQKQKCCAYKTQEIKNNQKFVIKIEINSIAMQIFIFLEIVYNGIYIALHHNRHGSFAGINCGCIAWYIASQKTIVQVAN